MSTLVLSVSVKTISCFNPPKNIDIETGSTYASTNQGRKDNPLAYFIYCNDLVGLKKLKIVRRRTICIK